MTTLNLPPQTSCYCVVDDLRESPGLANVQRSAPDDWAREELLLNKLGPRGWGRIHHFRNYYLSGWGGGSGQMLSPKALGAFFQFLESMNFPSGSQPSVFLTDRGGIELAWEDSSGKAVQVEFTRDGAEYFQEATGLEGCLSNGALRTLPVLLAC